MINEEDIVSVLKQHFPRYIGDDAAVIPKTAEEAYLMTKDVLIEDTHFRSSYFSPADLAHKALHVNLSDLAAMGARPLYILCGISIPERLLEYAQAVMCHCVEECKRLGIELIGGDTTRSSDRLYISMTAIGQARFESIKYRTTAQPGDFIYTVGPLGWAKAGLLALEAKTSTHERYIQQALRPNAKINEGRWLSTQSAVTSMMDISDGLYLDVQRLMQSSNVQAMLDIDKISAQLSEGISLTTALEGGEDYALLLTMTASAAMTLEKEFKALFGYALHQIGVVVKGQGVVFKQKGQLIELILQPFMH